MDKLGSLKDCGFDEVEERGNGYLVFKFYWGGWRLLVHKTKLLVKRLSKPLVAPMELNIEGDRVEYSVNTVEERALEAAKEAVRDWKIRLLNHSNGKFKLQDLELRRWKEHKEGPWLQDRDYVFNYGPGFREDMTREGGKLKLPLEDVEIDFSRGDEAHCEGTKEAVKDMTAAREARERGGVVLTEEGVREIFREEVGEMKSELKSDLKESFEGLRDEFLDELSKRMLRRVMDKEGDNSSDDSIEEGREGKKHGPEVV